MDNRQVKRPVQSLALILVFAVVYFVAARLSLIVAFEGSNATPVWPPTGIALAGILLLGYRVAPGILAGAFSVNLLVLSGIGFSVFDATITALITASGNTLEAVIGTALIRHFTGKPYPFNDVKDTVTFIVFGVLLSTMVCATIGVTALCFRTGSWALYNHLWLTWWLGDATGAIVVSPLILSWQKRSLSQWTNRKTGEALSLLVVLCGVGAFIFFEKAELRYIILPVLLWVVLRFGLFETCVSILLVSIFAVYGTLHTASGLSGKALNEPLLFLQSYIGVIAATILLLSVVVTGQRRSEEALRSAKAFTDTIINSIPGLFCVLDLKGRLVRWNRYLEEINDLLDEQPAGRDDLRNLYEEGKGLLAGKIAEAIEKGHSEAEIRILGKSGIRDFLFTSRRIQIDGLGYIVGSGTDITDCKNAERTLRGYQLNLEEMVEKRTVELTKVNAVLAAEIEKKTAVEKILGESERKYRDLVESANSVILRWTRQGQITFINTFAQRFFGYSEEEILGRNIVGTIVPETDSSGRDLSALAKSIAENSDAYELNENENIRKNGERVWVAWTNRPIIDEDGRIIEILSVGNDITGRKTAEDRLKQTLEELATAKEKAEAADHLKSAFLATMSHELRTPLNSIIGFTGIMLQGYAGPLTEEQTKQLNMVRRSANHLLSLINDVLDISKIEAGQLQVAFDFFDLKSTIEQTVQSSRPLADQKGIALLTSIASDVEGLVSDRRRFEQILLNLLSNAIKFTEEGRVNVACWREGEFVKIAVTDTGIGIRKDDMAKLFKAFQQIDSGITRKYEGTGLGLYICQRLMALLGGEIQVTSQWGSGTTISFTLPTEGGRS